MLSCLCVITQILVAFIIYKGVVLVNGALSWCNKISRSRENKIKLQIFSKKALTFTDFGIIVRIKQLALCALEC